MQSLLIVDHDSTPPLNDNMRVIILSRTQTKIWERDVSEKLAGKDDTILLQYCEDFYEEQAT